MKKLLVISLSVFALFLCPKVVAQEVQEVQSQPIKSVQEIKIGYVNTTELLDSLPEKKEAKAVLEDLNKKYKDELALMQSDYNKKYADFITYQKTMGENIKLRRMQELTELEKNINDFIQVAKTDVDNHEKQLVAPLREIVKKAIAEVGIENNITCIYDTASPSVVFLTPNAINLNDAVKNKLASRNE